MYRSNFGNDQVRDIEPVVEKSLVSMNTQKNSFSILLDRVAVIE